MRSLWGLVALAACAHASGGGDDDTLPSHTDGGIQPQACDVDQVATAIDASGVTCAPITAPIADAVTANCSTFAGWRDSCDGCVLDPQSSARPGRPARWASASTTPVPRRTSAART